MKPDEDEVDANGETEQENHERCMREGRAWVEEALRRLEEED